jgi:hypothetical protein
MSELYRTCPECGWDFVPNEGEDRTVCWGCDPAAVVQTAPQVSDTPKLVRRSKRLERAAEATEVLVEADESFKAKDIPDWRKRTEIACAACHHGRACPYGCDPGIPCDHTYSGYICRKECARSCGPRAAANHFEPA